VFTPFAVEVFAPFSSRHDRFWLAQQPFGNSCDYGYSSPDFGRLVCTWYRAKEDKWGTKEANNS
jgi:hypothetical protein